MQHMSAADGIAIHHCYDRFWQRTNLLLHIKHVEARHTVVADISATAFHIHVATGAESLVAGTGENHDTYALCFATPCESLTHLPCGARSERIAVAWAVDCYFGNTVIFFEKYFLEVEVFNLFPFSCFHIYVFFVSFLIPLRSSE